ncbi:JNK1/MAPK8-associated membrane protein [Schistocerca cancellata]|uniref:JNK1/MAPK8-associated membrane protein n=1 Tax=Schistocerca cancellata TaxID=274614 RepID=UPI0021198718|nr:JNK1/MAPK8-associated membrane protein [Schistocerca cancellata]
MNILGVSIVLYLSVGYIVCSDELANDLKPCPGVYCGREELPDGTWSNCSACPRGYRRNNSSPLSACSQCNESPVFYDWLYLGFMALIALVLHWFCIDTVSMKRSFCKEVLVLHVSAFLEIVGAAVYTLLMSRPVGSLQVSSCRAENLSDWYTLLHNPNPDYAETLHCTQEAVYPLYTMVFIFYAMSVLLMLVFRPWLARRFLPKDGKMSIYAALYFFPTLALIHAIFGGLIYYSFPYIVIILSVISNAVHFAFKLDQSMRYLVVSTVTEVRNGVILIGHWLLHAYGIIAITQLQDPVLHSSLVALVPLPAVFYILTARFTDPSKLHVD